MKKIVALCGMGLGSSLIIELNIKQVLEQLGLANSYEVTHENLNTYMPNSCDYVIVGKDIEKNVDAGENCCKIILTNIMDVDELKVKLKKHLK